MDTLPELRTIDDLKRLVGGERNLRQAEKILARPRADRRERVLPTVDSVLSRALSPGLLDRDREQAYSEEPLSSDVPPAEILPPEELGRDELLERVRHLEEENAELRAEIRASRIRIEDLLVTDLSHIPQFPGGRGNNPEEFLQKHYGEYLKYYGAERDVIYLDLVRSYDRKLVKRLETYFSHLRAQEKENEGVPVSPTPSEIIPDQARFRQELFQLTTVADAIEHDTIFQLLYNEVRDRYRKK